MNADLDSVQTTLGLHDIAHISIILKIHYRCATTCDYPAEA